MKKRYICSLVIVVIISISYFIDFYNSTKKITKIEYKIKAPSKSIFDETDEYILSVLACEMPASYNEEALKAQAVASRTFMNYRKKIDGAKKLTNKDQCTLSEEQMQSRWKSNYNKYYNKLKQIVNETKDEVVLKNDTLLKTFYFSTSNGYTEDSKAVFNQLGISSVKSSWDKKDKDYEKEITLTKQEMINKLGKFSSITITKRNKTNHVEEVMIDNKKMRGVEIRSKLGLRSTDFYINEINGIYKIKTYGYGHGVGMSQFGANYMANEGYNYHEILKYYYGNIDIQKINV